MKPDWESDCGRVALWCADCLDVLSGLEAGSVDAVVTDPPYGIGYSHGRVTAVNSKWDTKHHNTPIHGDDQPFDPSPWLQFNQCILWGANYFASSLPLAGWLVWDKRPGMGNMRWNRSEAELAFRKGSRTVQVFRHLWHGLCRDSEIGQHYHPTQKPVALMAWCVAMTTGTVLDPFLGSGTTALACIKTGRRFLGVEKEPRYFAVAVKRIKQALADERASLFPAAKETT